MSNLWRKGSGNEKLFFFLKKLNKGEENLFVPAALPWLLLQWLMIGLSDVAKCQIVEWLRPSKHRSMNWFSVIILWFQSWIHSSVDLLVEFVWRSMLKCLYSGSHLCCCRWCKKICSLLLAITVHKHGMAYDFHKTPLHCFPMPFAANVTYRIAVRVRGGLPYNAN